MAPEYIQHIEDVLDPGSCNYLMGLYNKSSNIVRRDNEVQHFGELNVHGEDPRMQEALVPFVVRAHEEYANRVHDARWMPPIRGVEGFRIKHYTGDSNDQFAPHVDIGDATSCKRYLAFLFYLNDGFDGGSTLFYNSGGDDVIITPKQGSVVVFPPTWQYPHVGMPVRNGDKYIMSSYLNYT